MQLCPKGMRSKADKGMVQVTSTDFAEGMVKVAKERAEAKGLKNMRSVLCEAEHHEFQVCHELHVDLLTCPMLSHLKIAWNLECMEARMSIASILLGKFSTSFSTTSHSFSLCRGDLRVIDLCSFAVADATNLVDYADGSFDVVSCASGLFMFPDPAR